jgi:hypothetical protein
MGTSSIWWASSISTSLGEKAALMVSAWRISRVILPVMPWSLAKPQALERSPP